MMGPSDPFTYKPTMALWLLILFVIFPLIYIFGRLVTFLVHKSLVTFLVHKSLMSMKRLLIWIYEFLYLDDFEAAQENEKRSRRKHQRKHLNSPSSEFGGKSNGNPAAEITKNESSSESTELRVDTKAELKDEVMRHSPTDEENDPDTVTEEKCETSSKTSFVEETIIEKPGLRHRKVDPTAIEHEPSLEPKIDRLFLQISLAAEISLSLPLVVLSGDLFKIVEFVIKLTGLLSMTGIKPENIGRLTGKYPTIGSNPVKYTKNP
uniref:Uncharacterized protein n=1 Tax=Panagrolaimus sp. JU765 TaxID=591449 RepID=A0AC34R619_9BILA